MHHNTLFLMGGKGEEWLHPQQRQQSFIPLLPEILDQLLPSRWVLEGNVKISVIREVPEVVDVLSLIPAGLQQDLLDEEIS